MDHQWPDCDPKCGGAGFLAVAEGDVENCGGERGGAIIRDIYCAGAVSGVRVRIPLLDWGISNVLKVSHQEAIRSLQEKGWSQWRIARELGIDRDTNPSPRKLPNSKPVIDA